MGEKKFKSIEAEFLSTGTIARKLDLSTQTIRREISAGHLKAQYFNGNYIVAAADFADWKARRIKPTGV